MTADAIGERMPGDQTARHDAQQSTCSTALIDTPGQAVRSKSLLLCATCERRHPRTVRARSTRHASICVDANLRSLSVSGP